MTAKGGQSNQETVGDGRQERAPNKTRFKAAALCCHSRGEGRREGERERRNIGRERRGVREV